MSTLPTHITCSSLSFAWPDGTAVFDDFQLAVGPGRTGLIGLNGSGKSTLLKLIAGELTPVRRRSHASRASSATCRRTWSSTPRCGSTRCSASPPRAPRCTPSRRATRPRSNFAAVGDDWDVEERARATLDQLGLGHIGLDRTIGEVSGGECVLLRLAALLLAGPDVLLLDEPTNNLDLYARRRLYDGGRRLVRGDGRGQPRP